MISSATQLRTKEPALPDGCLEYQLQLGPFFQKKSPTKVGTLNTAAAAISPTLSDPIWPNSLLPRKCSGENPSRQFPVKGTGARRHRAIGTLSGLRNKKPRPV